MAFVHGLNPDIIKIGPIRLRWYGLMYLLGFLASYFLIRNQPRARRLGLQGRVLQDLLFYIGLGLIAGARLGYILFYQFHDLGHYIQHPVEIIAIWHGGMSFHGGLIGALMGGIYFCRRCGLPLWEVADTVIVTAPIGLGLGRVGNFINGELYGRPSSLPWAVIFPAGGTASRHPSQLYEAALEGLLLFIVLWRLNKMDLAPGSMVCLFLGGYGLLRFVAEFFRQPDAQLGLLGGLLSMGQVLCLGMILMAPLLWGILRKTIRSSAASPPKKG